MMSDKERNYIYSLIEADQHHKVRKYAEWCEETHRERERLEHENEEKNKQSKSVEYLLPVHKRELDV